MYVYSKCKETSFDLKILFLKKLITKTCIKLKEDFKYSFLFTLQWSLNTLCSSKTVMKVKKLIYFF